MITIKIMCYKLTNLSKQTLFFLTSAIPYCKLLFKTVLNFDFSKKIQTNKYDVEKSKVWRNGLIICLLIFGIYFYVLKC